MSLLFTIRKHSWYNHHHHRSSPSKLRPKSNCLHTFPSDFFTAIAATTFHDTVTVRRCENITDGRCVDLRNIRENDVEDWLK